jgi:branched-chain amino acid transport system substrate-binding protein
MGAVGSTVAGASKTPFRILMLEPASTSYQKTSVQTVNLMAKSGVTVINRSGGVDGHRVVLTVVNDGATPTTAVTKLESALASANKPDIVINADGGAEASAELPILTQAKVLDFNEAPTTTSGNPKMFPHSFDMSPSTTSYAAVFPPT